MNSPRRRNKPFLRGFSALPENSPIFQWKWEESCVILDLNGRVELISLKTAQIIK